MREQDLPSHNEPCCLSPVLLMLLVLMLLLTMLTSVTLLLTLLLLPELPRRGMQPSTVTGAPTYLTRTVGLRDPLQLD